MPDEFNKTFRIELIKSSSKISGSNQYKTTLSGIKTFDHNKLNLFLSAILRNPHSSSWYLIIKSFLVPQSHRVHVKTFLLKVK